MLIVRQRWNLSGFVHVRITRAQVGLGQPSHVLTVGRQVLLRPALRSRRWRCISKTAVEHRQVVAAVTGEFLFCQATGAEHCCLQRLLHHLPLESLTMHDKPECASVDPAMTSTVARLVRMPNHMGMDSLAGRC